MENPPTEISHIIHLLTQSPPTTQRATIEKYFAPNASFTHPFCRTGSWDGSRWLIWCIYRWYKILSPRIEIAINSVTYDPTNLILYVSLRQLFRLWFLPFYSADVELVTVLRLVKVSGSLAGEAQEEEKEREKVVYLIKSQNDLYQVNEFMKFVSVFGALSLVVYVWQAMATFLCVIGAGMLWPVSWVEEKVVGGNRERSLADAVKG